MGLPGRRARAAGAQGIQGIQGIQGGGTAGCRARKGAAGGGAAKGGMVTKPLSRTYMGLSENVGYIPNEIAI